MKTITSRLINLAVISMSISFSQITQAGTSPFPSDPDTTCTVTQSTFNSWFGTKKAPAKNAPANAADSLNFPTNNTKCDFYRWSAQMFLWLSSPAGQSYVFDSLTFFDVSPKKKDAQGNHYRTLVPNNMPGSVGGLFSVRTTKGDETLTGEVGQAGGDGVLIAQKGSIVYYGIHVNDVYAYFLSSQKNVASPTLTDFPNTKSELKKVTKYAKSQGVTLNDKNALTMELKTSWVDIASVNDPTQYLTITAKVPNYTRSATKPKTVWKLNGVTTKTLALVGMHIVGTVKDHPEMVWATVEHMNNAPDSNYHYKNSRGTISEVTMPTTGDWVFTKSPIQGGVQWNAERATVNSSGDIVATKQNTIGPSTTVRLNPWGSASSSAPTTVDKGVTTTPLQDPENNAELISLNNDVLKWMPKGDVRANYFVSGAVWTWKGNIPTYDGKGPAFTQKGSLSLANATMETYHQDIASSPTTADAGCFMCHSISGKQATKGQGVEVSHIYDEIKPIPKISKK